MSGRFPTSFVRRDNHHASHPVPYTRHQWEDAIKLAILNDWRSVGRSGVVFSKVHGILRSFPDPARYQSLVFDFAFRTGDIPDGVSMMFADDVLVDSLSSDLSMFLLFAFILVLKLSRCKLLWLLIIQWLVVTTPLPLYHLLKLSGISTNLLLYSVFRRL
jgi:hypothetical protein